MRERLLATTSRLGDAFTAMAAIDTAPRLDGIKVPTLCLAGEVDKSTPPPVVKAMADAIPGARFAVLPGGPHMPFVEMPEEVAKVVGGFFKEVLGPSDISPERGRSTREARRVGLRRVRHDKPHPAGLRRANLPLRGEG